MSVKDTSSHTVYGNIAYSQVQVNVCLDTFSFFKTTHFFARNEVFFHSVPASLLPGI